MNLKKLQDVICCRATSKRHATPQEAIEDLASMFREHDHMFCWAASSEYLMRGHGILLGSEMDKLKLSPTVTWTIKRIECNYEFTCVSILLNVMDVEK